MSSAGSRVLGCEEVSPQPNIQPEAHGLREDELEKREQRQQPPRKRARMACTWCRDRKVRCDVSIHGKPCTNCQLDRHECALQPSVSRGRAAEVARLRKPASGANALGRTPKVAIPQIAHKLPQTPLFGIWKEGKASLNWDLQYDPKSPQVAPSPSYNNQSDSNVTFSFYSFLKLPGLPNIPPEDAKFLEMKGCLHVPSRTILDEFIRQYFLHVHPCLPVLNEADFWRLYRGKPDRLGKESSISLFTFQAMLFASCAFVPSKAVKLAGFENLRAARNSLYYRAKLLFDLKSEGDVLAKAQGALLLTYQSSSVELHAGSIWLTVAIQNAIIYGAHVYGTDEKLGNHGSQENIKKRLWWSILLRDRILPLGLRRHLQITPQNFNLSLDRITELDLEDEIHNSEVYDPETKRLLIRVLQVQCELAIVLTDVIMLAYAPNCFGQPRTMPEPVFSQKIREVENLKANLNQWSNDAKSSLGSVLNSDKVHKSVTLYSGLTFLYYQAARLALCHFQAFTLEAHQMYLGKSHERLIKPIREEIENAASCITDSVKGFLFQGVAHHLPISAVAYTALPLLLNALDVKLSASKSQSATRQRRFRYYAEIMQLYTDRYDGTDGVAVFVQQALRLADTLNVAMAFQGKHGGKKQPESNGWSEVFARAPRSYLRLSLSLDYAFTHGYFPEGAELPTLAWEPFIENRIPYSLSSPSVLKPPGPLEAFTMESPVCETPDAIDTEDQQQQPTSPTHAQTTPIAHVSSTYPPEPTPFDFNSIMESDKSSQQETSLSVQFPLTHNRSRPARNHNFRDQGLDFLDFLDFGSPAPEPQSSGQHPDQEENYPLDRLNNMDFDTFLDLSNEMAEACSSTLPSNEDQDRKYSSDSVNAMGVHTVMNFDEEIPFWSDYMINEILSPIPQSGA